MPKLRLGLPPFCALLSPALARIFYQPLKCHYPGLSQTSIFCLLDPPRKTRLYRGDSSDTIKNPSRQEVRNTTLHHLSPLHHTLIYHSVRLFLPLLNHLTGLRCLLFQEFVAVSVAHSHQHPSQPSGVDLPNPTLATSKRASISLSGTSSLPSIQPLHPSRHIPTFLLGLSRLCIAAANSSIQRSFSSAPTTEEHFWKESRWSGRLKESSAHSAAAPSIHASSC